MFNLGYASCCAWFLGCDSYDCAIYSIMEFVSIIDFVIIYHFKSQPILQAANGFDCLLLIIQVFGPVSNLTGFLDVVVACGFSNAFRYSCCIWAFIRI